MDQVNNIALNKLIILYYMKALSIPLTNPQITQFFLENDIIPYFDLQLFLSELVESQLLSYLETRNKFFYSITSSGTETLSFFEYKINDNLKSRIDGYARENQNRLRTESQITSEYKKVSRGQYIVTCRVMEQDMILLELKLNVADSSQAKQMCESWQSRAPEIYKDIISALID